MLLIAGLSDAFLRVFAWGCSLTGTLIAGITLFHLIGRIALSCIFAVSTEVAIAELSVRTVAVARTVFGERLAAVLEALFLLFAIAVCIAFKWKVTARVS